MIFRNEALALRSILNERKKIQHQEEIPQKEEPRASLVQNVANKVQKSIQRHPSAELSALVTDTFPPPPPDLPPSPPPPPPPYSCVTIPKYEAPTKQNINNPKTILKKSSGQPFLIGDHSTNLESSTSGYSTVTELGRPISVEDATASKNYKWLTKNDRTNTDGVKNTSTDRVDAYSKKSPDYIPPPPIASTAVVTKAQTAGSSYTPTRSSIKSKHQGSNLSNSFQRAVHDKLKKYSGRPQESWASQIEKGVATEEKKLIDKPLAYEDSEKSGKRTPVSASLILQSVKHT